MAKRTKKTETNEQSELKDVRIPIMMSGSEVEAIDDWSFQNRIRSRSEAIRRLCQGGLELSRNEENLRVFSKAVSDIAIDFLFLISSSNIDDTEKKSEIIRNFKNFIELFKEVNDLTSVNIFLKAHDDVNTIQENMKIFLQYIKTGETIEALPKKEGGE